MIRSNNLQDWALMIAGLLFIIATVAVIGALCWIGLHLLWKRLNGE